MTRPNALENRHEFVLFFDVTNGNPNGDPDAGNMPRMDPETGHGLVSDVCLKRKVRNYVEMAKDDATRFRIYVTEGAILNDKHREAYAAVTLGSGVAAVTPDTAVTTVTPGITTTSVTTPGVKDGKRLEKMNPKSDEEAQKLRDFMCDNFFDVRTFGAVMSTGINVGQVRGPVQMCFARSIDPILPLEMSITRMAATNEAEKAVRKEGDTGDEKAGDEKRGDKRTMGRKHIVPYGLYRAHGFVSAPLASDERKGTGFSNEDLELLFEALGNMFEHDRSAARGEMATRQLIVFKHNSKLGSAHAHALFDKVETWRVWQGEKHRPGDTKLDNASPARSFADYAITIDRSDLPDGIEIIER